MSANTSTKTLAGAIETTQDSFATSGNDSSSIDIVADTKMTDNASSSALYETTNTSTDSDLNSGISIIDFAYHPKNMAVKNARNLGDDSNEQPAYKFKKLDSAHKARTTAYVRKQRTSMSGGTNHQIEWKDEEEEAVVDVDIPFEQLAARNKAAAAKSRFERKELSLNTNLDLTFKHCNITSPTGGKDLDSGIELNDSSDGNSSPIAPPSTPLPTSVALTMHAAGLAAAQQAPKHTNLSVNQRDMSRACASGVASTMRFPYSPDDFANEEEFEETYTLTRRPGHVAKDAIHGALHAFNERRGDEGDLPLSFGGSQGGAAGGEEEDDDDPFANDDIRMW